MSIYEKLKELNIDLSPVGINTNEAGELYYCTPDGPVAMAVSIIGGARGLTGINKNNVRSACSSMHFDDEFDVNWMLIFFIKELDDIVVRIEAQF